MINNQLDNKFFEQVGQLESPMSSMDEFGNCRTPVTDFQHC